MNKRTPNFTQKGFSGNFLQLMNWIEQNQLCCLDFLTKIYTSNTADIVLSGAGTENDPLKATLVTPGGGGLLTGAINGLHVSGANVLLGGPLTEATTIDQANTANFINITGVAGGSPFRIAGGAIPLTITGATTTGASITSSALGAAIVGGTTGLTVVAPTVGATFTAGGATSAVSNTSALIATQSAPFVPVSLFVKQDVSGSISGQTIALDGLILRRDNGPTVAIPVGAGISMKMQFQTAGQIRESFRVSAICTTVGGLNTDIQFWNLRSSSVQHTTMLSTGQIQFNQYTGATPFPGTVARMLAIDSTGNVITTAPVTAVVAANNGLSLSGTTVQLGGSLIQATTIATSGTSVLTITGTGGVFDSAALIINNTGGGTGISATSSNRAIFAQSTGSGAAITGQSVAAGGFGISASASAAGGAAIVAGTSGTGSTAVQADTSADGTAVMARANGTGLSLLSQSTNPSNNSVVTLISVDRLTSAANTAAGLGASIDFKISTGNTVLASLLSNQIISKWTDVATATRTSQFEIWGVNSATTLQHLTFDGAGQLQLNQYTGTNFTGTPVRQIGLDAAGKIVTSALPTNTVTVSNNTTATVTVTSAQSGTVFTNEGAAANVTFNLPTATVGLYFEFINVIGASSNVIIDPNGTETIKGETNSGIAGATATSAGIMDNCKIVCHVAGQWLLLNDPTGNWTIA